MIAKESPQTDFPIEIELPVLWGHMDAFQHVNNVQYLRYMESARIAYGDRIRIFELMKEEGIGPILAATTCNYLKPLRYPDTVRVGCRTTHLTVSEIEQEFAVYSLRLQKLAAKGTAKIVAYDYKKLERTTFPRSLLTRILQLEKGLELS